MELRTFIKQAIIDIVGGVIDAQEALPPGRVVPSTSDDYKSVETGIFHVQGVEFEVVVRAEEKQGSEAKLNVCYYSGHKRQSERVERILAVQFAGFPDGADDAEGI